MTTQKDDWGSKFQCENCIQVRAQKPKRFFVNKFASSLGFNIYGTYTKV